MRLSVRREGCRSTYARHFSRLCRSTSPKIRRKEGAKPASPPGFVPCAGTLILLLRLQGATEATKRFKQVHLVSWPPSDNDGSGGGDVVGLILGDQPSMTPAPLAPTPATDVVDTVDYFEAYCSCWGNPCQCTGVFRVNKITNKTLINSAMPLGPTFQARPTLLSRLSTDYSFCRSFVII